MPRRYQATQGTSQKKIPNLASAEVGETLYLYLAVAEETISAVLVKEKPGVQYLIYYVSKVLHGPESRYSLTEKLVLCLVHAARRLKSYFMAHPICVKTDQPLCQILNKSEASTRLTKWAIELEEHDISYEPQTAIKAQVLADFLAEFANRVPPLSPDHLREEEINSSSWNLFVDGSSNREGYGAGLLLISPEGNECCCSLRFRFRTSNNGQNTKL